MHLYACLICALGVCATAAPLNAEAEPGTVGNGEIADCPPDHRVRFTVGYGRTFNFFYLLNGEVIPATVTWSCDRYELGVFRFGTQDQNIHGGPQRIARADWAASLSRRWYLHRWHGTGLFFGLGASYRTLAGNSEGNTLNGSRLNFAEQLGLRWVANGNRPGLELSLRHFSNAGIVQPNKGQNFIDLAVVF